MKKLLSPALWTGADRHKITHIVLAGIVLAGFVLRVWHLDYDQRMGSHPDERSNSYYAVSIRMPEDIENLLHPRLSPLNPFWDIAHQWEKHFTYGHFPLYLGVTAAWIVHNATPLLEALGFPDSWVTLASEAQTEPRSFLFIGRLMIILLDTLTIWLMFLIARRLYGVRAGLLAALLWCIAVMPLKDSHFFTMDVALTTCVTLTLLGYLMMLDRPGSLKGLGLTGLGLGLSVASKFSALPIVCLFAGLWLLQWHRRSAADTVVRFAARALLRCGAVIGLAAGIYVLTSPFVVLDWDVFEFSVLKQQGDMVTGNSDWPFTRQYRGTVPYLYYIQQQVQWGLWYPLGLTAVLGTLWALLRLPFAFRRDPATWFPRPRAGEWLVLLWIVLYFGPTGAFLAKFNRYMLPMLPAVILLGIGLMTWICGWWRDQPSALQTLLGQSRRRWVSRFGPRLGVVWIGVVVAGSLFWLGANVNGIFNRHHTWYEASRWIYQNAPDGSTFFWEHWDDPLPVPWELVNRLDPTVPRKEFHRVDWSPFEEEDETKLELLKSLLLETDYVVFSSRRTLGGIARLPGRYPLANRYYELLFNGELGFEVVLHVERHPQAWGLRFNDTWADESWRLYDHPPTVVLAKVKPMSEREYHDLLVGYVDDAQNWYLPTSHFPTNLLAKLRMPADGEGAAETGFVGDAVHSTRRTLGRFIFGKSTPETLDYPLDARQSFDRFRFNAFGSTRTWAATLFWWLGLALMGLIAWPFGFALFGGLPDGGHALSRGLGWLGLALISWWAAHLGLPAFTVIGVWAGVAAVGIAAAFLAWRQRQALVRKVRRQWRLLLWQEVGFAGAYLLFVLLRLFNPDLWQPWTGGEKFMDLAILNGILHSPVFPPIDPHFAGKFLNYYYLGHYLVAYLIKLTGLWTEVAYNLALAALFAQVVLLSWSCAFYFHMRNAREDGETDGAGSAPAASWTSPLTQALWAPLLLTGIGNLDGARQLVALARAHAQEAFTAWPSLLRVPARTVRGLWELGWTDAVAKYDFWGPSRVIPNTINEFPYWTFLFGDLHAHLLVIPTTLLLLCCLVYGWFYEGNVRRIPALLLVIAVIASVGIATNLWELPLYVSLLVLFLAALGQRLVPQRWALAGGGAGLLMLLTGLLVLFPFWRHFEVTAASGLGWIQGGDALDQWLRIWGLFYAVILSWLCLRLHAAWSNQDPDTVKAEMRLLGLLVALCLLPFLFGQRQVLALALLPLALNAFLLWKHRTALAQAEGQLLCWLLPVLGIWAATQIWFVRDFLSGGGVYRMNTLFKFFLQAWVVAAVAVGMLLPSAWRQLKTLGGSRLAWAGGGAFGVLLAASMVYPVIGTPARLAERFPVNAAFGTLNGLDYMATGTYRRPDNQEVLLAYDREAIDWLNTHIDSNLVILESYVVDYYRAAGTRIASHTGLPGLLGMHESEQRDPDSVGKRSGIMRDIWDADTAAQMLELLNRHSVALIYAGQLEEIEHPQGISHLTALATSGLLELVYENPKTRIYALPGQIGQTVE